MLGINLEGLREACELVGFPYRCYKDGMRNDAWKKFGEYAYKREDHPEMAWADKAYPGTGFLGYDFCCAIKVWLKANGHENESICQVLLKRGSKNVRRANLFYSHTQGVYLKETIKRMREGIEAHKAQLPQATEEAKALAAEQRARLAELKAQIEAEEDGETYNKLQAEQEAGERRAAHQPLTDGWEAPRRRHEAAGATLTVGQYGDAQLLTEKEPAAKQGSRQGDGSGCT